MSNELSAEQRTKRFWSKGEVRLNDDGSIDEIVIGQTQFFHLEQMDGGHWWLAVDGKDGRRMCINFYRQGQDIRVTCEDDGFHSSGITEGFKP